MSRSRLSLLVVSALIASGAAAGTARADDTRYSLVHGCYALKSATTGGFVARGPGKGYTTSAGDPAGAEGFRMQATALGRYLLYGRGREVLGVTAQGVEALPQSGPNGDLVVDSAPGGTFSVVSGAGQAVVAGAGGRLVTGGQGQEAGRFAFVPAQGCADFPEAELNASGTPGKGSTPYGETRGFIDAHMHMMGFEFLGGEAHCGRPWSPYGIEVALAGCPRTEVASPVVEQFLSGGTPTKVPDPVGWPTFNDWPKWNALAHEQSYYKWLERAWLGGQRIFVNLFVENHALCTLYPHKRNSCNEMESVRLQAKDLTALQDYIDAQEGGPGKGWFRIVKDPFEARRIVNEGKLAVIPGIEVSNLFDCGLVNGVSPCTPQDVDKRLAEVYNDLGVRDMELINKFNNGFGGVAGDEGETGLVVNQGNKLETGSYWDMKTCTGPPEETDREQSTLPGTSRDDLIGQFGGLLPPGQVPVYPPGPHCNTMGLTELGRHLVSAMMDRRMIVDPDHLDVIARKGLLDLVEARKYSGIVSSHSWSTQDAYPRIYKLGGFVAPYAGAATSFAAQWQRLRKEQDPRFYSGIGWGADMNGFGAQGPPRKGANPVTYPFKSFDGKVTFDRQKTGSRTFDVNDDGVAHYGLYPDWVEDLRKVAGNEIVDDLSRGPEAYLQMWERAVGVVPRDVCRETRLRFTSKGIGLVRLGAPAEENLRGAGQPVTRVGTAWRYCVRNRSKDALTALYTPQGTVGLVASNSPRHRVGGVGAGSRASLVPKAARRLTTGIMVRTTTGGRRFLYGVRSGRVRWTAVGVASMTTSPTKVKKALALAGLR